MNYSFDSIAGYSTEKEELARLCEIFNNRKAYEAKGAKLPKGIIFYGEAGTGKTLFAKVMASVCKLNTITIDIGNADTEVAICRRIRRAFVKATKSNEPTMIFFPEIDKVLPNYEEGYVTERDENILSQLLTQIGCMDSSKNVVFVATCNYYDCLPETLVCDGRIDKKLHIDKPAYHDCLDILNLYAQNTTCKFAVSMDDLARFCAGFSCAALEKLINEFVLRCDANGVVSEQLVAECISEFRNNDIPRLKSNLSKAIVACSNIGAFIVSRMFNKGDYVLSLDNYASGNVYFDRLLKTYDSHYNEDYYDDYEEPYEYYEYFEGNLRQRKKAEEYERALYYSKADKINAICVLMGKVVAQEIVFNKVYDNNGEAVNIIDRILFSMSHCGQLGINLVYLPQRERALGYSDKFKQNLNDEFCKITTYCYNKAKAVITANEALVRQLIRLLVENESFSGEALDPIIDELGGIKYVD